MNYQNINLCIAENGYILNYCIKEEEEGEEGMMYNMEHKSKVYTFAQGNDALEEMKKMNRTNKEYPLTKELPMREKKEKED